MGDPRPRWLSCAALAIALLALVGCGRGTNPTDSASLIVDKFLAARDTKNLDATMDCFADQPEMRSSLGVGWTGRDMVRAIMAYRLMDSYTVADVHVVGDRVIWTEHVRRSMAGFPNATFDEDVEATVINGRIGSMVTYVGGAHPKLTIDANAQPETSTNALLPLSILVLIAAAVMVWPPAAPLTLRRGGNRRLLAG